MFSNARNEDLAPAMLNLGLNVSRDLELNYVQDNKSFKGERPVAKRTS